MAGKGLSIEQETKIVMLLARGDEYKEIMKQVDVSINTITKVKNRNKANLALIAEKVMEKTADDAADIKQKANKLISKRLDKADTAQQLLEKAQQDFMDDKITYKEFADALRRIKEIGINELVTVSKEMHNQSSKGDEPPASSKDLATLAAALKSGDTLKITQAVFSTNPQPDAQPPIV
jgi:transposase